MTNVILKWHLWSSRRWGKKWWRSECFHRRGRKRTFQMNLLLKQGNDDSSIAKGFVQSLAAPFALPVNPPNILQQSSVCMVAVSMSTKFCCQSILRIQILFTVYWHGCMPNVGMNCLICFVDCSRCQKNRQAYCGKMTVLGLWKLYTLIQMCFSCLFSEVLYITSSLIMQMKHWLCTLADILCLWMIYTDHGHCEILCVNNLPPSGACVYIKTSRLFDHCQSFYVICWNCCQCVVWKRIWYCCMATIGLLWKKVTSVSGK